MQIGGMGGAAAIWLNSLGKTAEASPADAFAPAKAGQKEQAKPAASNTSFPTVAPVNFDTATLLALQETDTKAIGEEIKDGKSDAVDDFLDYMKKTPEERLRDKILKALGMTEEKIREIIKETIVPEEVTRGASTDDAQSRLTFDQLVQQA